MMMMMAMMIIMVMMLMMMMARVRNYLMIFVFLGNFFVFVRLLGLRGQAGGTEGGRGVDFS